jgi:hypothetical protein
VRAGAAGYWPALALYAVRTGFAGALSTVSTYVAEVGAPVLGPETLPPCAQLMWHVLFMVRDGEYCYTLLKLRRKLEIKARLALVSCLALV